MLTATAVRPATTSTTAVRPTVPSVTAAVVQAGMTPEQVAALKAQQAADRAAAQARAEAQAAVEAADAQAAAAEAAAAAAAAATAPAPAAGYPPGSISAWSPKLGRWRVAVPATGAGLGVADSSGICIFGDCGLGQAYTEDTSMNVVYLTDPATTPPGTTPVPEGDLDDKTGKSKLYKKWWFWAAIGGGVIVLGGGAYYLTRKKK